MFGFSLFGQTPPAGFPVRSQAAAPPIKYLAIATASTSRYRVKDTSSSSIEVDDSAASQFKIRIPR